MNAHDIARIQATASKGGYTVEEVRGNLVRLFNEETKDVVICASDNESILWAMGL